MPLNKTIIALSLLTLFACSKKTNEPVEIPKLILGPLPGIYISYDSQSNTFRLGNEFIERRLMLNSDNNFLYTFAFINKLSGRNYIKSPDREISFSLGDKEISGLSGDLEYVSHEITGTAGIKMLELEFKITIKEKGILNLSVFYQIFQGFPVIKKWIEIKNPTGSGIAIKNIKTEYIKMSIGLQNQIYNRYTSFIFDFLANEYTGEEIAIGNETPGILKENLITANGFISVGIKSRNKGFEIPPGQKLVFPASLIFILSSDNKDIISSFLEYYLPAYERKDLSIWYEDISPGIDMQNLQKKMTLAAESGAKTFCLKGKWANKRGDWSTESNLEISSQYVHSIGLKLGVAVDIAVADVGSQALEVNTDQKVEVGDESNISIPDNGKLMCLASSYASYVSYELDSMVKNYGIDYLRFTGSIIPNGDFTGCSASKHIHYNPADSIWYIYQGLFTICDYLHRQNPDLIIQVHPESYNPINGVDLALLYYTDLKLILD
ncbi:hypothetical protein GF312_15075 [Candidatus Poribacteria bacterium]|nr:hypothetical protein [Candidatus Poribacteria bacterium]